MAADQPQWGQPYTRKMVSRETGLAEWFDSGQVDPVSGNLDLKTTRNIQQVARFGKQTHGMPLIAGGRVYGVATWPHLWAIAGHQKPPRGAQ